MRNAMKILTAMLLLMLLLMASAAMAENTALKVRLVGYTPTEDGDFDIEMLDGSFRVMQNAQEIGIIKAGMDYMLELETAEAVDLVPLAGTISDDYLVNYDPMPANITANKVNVVTVLVYADCGMITLLTDGPAEFTIFMGEEGKDPEGEYTFVFTTDQYGRYELPRMVRTGAYILRQLTPVQGKVSMLDDISFMVKQFKGEEEQITQLDLRSNTIKRYGTPVPVFSPTPKPTPTPIPATPRPEIKLGTLLMDLTGEDVTIGYTLMANEEVLQSGVLSASQPLMMADIQARNDYQIEFMVPQGYLIEEINGMKTMLAGTVRCNLPVRDGNGNIFHVKAAAKGKITGMLDGVKDGTVITFTGSQDSASATVSKGAFVMDAVMAGVYRVTLSLPDDLYTGDGWIFERDENGLTATTSIRYDGQERFQLAAIKKTSSQMVSGKVVNNAGRAVAGAQVSIAGKHGEKETMTTDASGQWGPVRLPLGTYSLIVTQEGDTLLHGVEVNVTEKKNEPVILTVQEGNATIAVSVFNDRNKNGEMNPYDELIAGAVVELIHIDGDDEAVMTSLTTDKKNPVTFTMLAGGQYKLRVTMPTGYAFAKKSDKEGYRAASSIMEQSSEASQTSAVISISNRSKTEVGVAAMAMSAATGRIWIDQNGDGVMDRNEPGLSGVQLQAIGTKNGMTYETVSGEDGQYVFDRLKPGAYQLLVTLPDGYGFTKRAKKNGSIIIEEGVASAGRVVDLNNAKTLRDQNVGVVLNGAVQVLCFEDANHNGLLDEGEKMLPGVTCKLYKRGSNNSMATIVSDEQGAANFGHLRAGTYSVLTQLPNNAPYSYTVAAEGGNQHTAQPGKGNATVNDISVAVGEVKQLVVGAVIPGTVSGVVYIDDDFNGMKGDQEKGVRDVDVKLLDTEGKIVASVRTDGNGAYTFSKIYPGPYRISVQAKTGYAFTQPGEGSVVTQQSGGAGTSELFSLGLAEDKTNVDCGMIIPGKVEGTVWADENANTVMDSDEAGLTTALIRLVSQSGVVTETYPAKNGSFVFDAVIPGTYAVEYVLPQYGVFTNDAGMAADETLQKIISEAFTMEMGGQMKLPAIGALQQIPVNGYAYYDANSNGMMDEHERLLGGVEMSFSLEGEEATKVSTQTSGNFDTILLVPGRYQVTVKLPDGYVLGTQSVLGFEYGKNESVIQLYAASGTSWENMVISALKPASVSGALWMDEDGNGRVDYGEAAPAGEVLTLYSMPDQKVLATLTTDENGAFNVSCLMPGKYRLSYKPKAGAVASVGGDTTFVQEGSSMVMDLELHCDDHVDTARLGLISYTTVGGLVWKDHNGKVEPMPGAKVRLLNEAGQVLAETESGKDGRYQFNELRTGNYALDVTLPEHQLVVTQNDHRIAGDEGAVSVMTACVDRYGKSDLFHVRMGYHQMDLDIGAVGYGTIGDFCWLDLNGNGLQESGEGGLPNMVVQLLQQGQVIAQTMTDQYGYYRFNDLYPAVYTLRVVYDANVLAPTTMRTDFKNIVSILQEDGSESLPVDLESNGTYYDADFGFVLVDAEGEMPLGYGMGLPMNWNPKKK